VSNQCRVLPPVCIYRGASLFDFGVRIIDVDGDPVDISAFDATYTWTREGQKTPTINWDQDDTEITMGAGVDDNQMTIALAGSDTEIAVGSYCVAYTVDDGAGNVWIAARHITVKKAC